MTTFRGIMGSASRLFIGLVMLIAMLASASAYTYYYDGGDRYWDYYDYFGHGSIYYHAYNDD
ncbi:MAG: hypothetical protein ABIH41_06815, partial [Nanoarchaeota archaeon]